MKPKLVFMFIESKPKPVPEIWQTAREAILHFGFETWQQRRKRRTCFNFMLMIHKWNGYVNNIRKVTYLYTNARCNQVIGLQRAFFLRLVMKASKKVNWNVLWTKCWRIWHSHASELSSSLCVKLSINIRSIRSFRSGVSAIFRNHQFTEMC